VALDDAIPGASEVLRIPIPIVLGQIEVGQELSLADIDVSGRHATKRSQHAGEPRTTGFRIFDHGQLERDGLGGRSGVAEEQAAKP
jgi:hypothetical protein